MADAKFRIAIVTTVAIVLSVGGLLAQEAKKVSREDAMSAVVSKVHPEYPPTAKQLHIQGTVEVGIQIDESGGVSKATAVSGNPVLTRPAVDALKKWKFKPFQEDGKPVKAETTLAVTFKL